MCWEWRPIFWIRVFFPGTASAVGARLSCTPPQCRRAPDHQAVPKGGPKTRRAPGDCGRDPRNPVAPTRRYR